MKTYYVYWTPQQHMMAKVEAETPEDAYKAVAGEIDSFIKSRIVYQEIQEEDMTSYEVYEDDENHDSIILKGTYRHY